MLVGLLKHTHNLNRHLYTYICAVYTFVFTKETRLDYLHTECQCSCAQQCVEETSVSQFSVKRNVVMNALTVISCLQYFCVQLLAWQRRYLSSLLLLLYCYILLFLQIDDKRKSYIHTHTHNTCCVHTQCLIISSFYNKRKE